MDKNNLQAFESIISKAKAIQRPLRVAIASASADNILLGAFAAQEDGFVEPILIGKEEKIKAALDRVGLSDRPCNIQGTGHGVNAVQYAVDMVNADQADAIMRGNTQTRDFLLPILNKANGLVADDRLVSHVVFLNIPGYDRILAVSDVTLLVEPNPNERKKVAANITSALKIFDVEHPNIALLSLVDTPSFHMRNSVEAQTIVREHKERPVADCNLVGPIPYDLIISKEAARLKGYDCGCSGEFDGIVMPNLLSGNLLVKVLEHNAGAYACGVLVGANIPVAITSRSDAPEQAYLSLAACAAMAGYPGKKFFK